MESSSTPTQRKTAVTEQDIKRMLQTKDFYELLGVSKTATDEDLKKQYKKLALKYHPDKLRLPGAQEVFKKIAHAYSALTDPNKRAYYDRTGSDEPQQQRSYEQQYYYQDDIDPNDIFNAFFGFGFQQQSFDRQRRTQYRTYRTQSNRDDDSQNRSQKQSGSSLGTLLQLLPILLILFSSSFGSFFQESPQYSMHKTQSFPIAKESVFLGVRYYVDTYFEDKVMENIDYLPNFEWKVEYQYINSLRQTCQNQKNKKIQYANHAKMSWTKRDKQYYQNISDQMDLSTCKEVEGFERRYNIQNYY